MPKALLWTPKCVKTCERVLITKILKAKNICIREDTPAPIKKLVEDKLNELFEYGRQLIAIFQKKLDDSSH